MNFLQRLKEKQANRNDIYTFSYNYYELSYEKFGKPYFICFTSPSLKKAKVRAKSIVNDNGGDKLKSLRKLDERSLGKSLTWNKRGYYRTSRKPKAKETADVEH